MDIATVMVLAAACAPQIDAGTAHALVSVESSHNPWAIGVVGGQLARQPRSHAEALATARALQSEGWNFSVGLGQINVGNFERLGLTLSSAFEPCTNLAAMQAVLVDCFDRAAARVVGTQRRLRMALSCYYAGNFTTGFHHGYVGRVAKAALRPVSRAPPVQRGVAVDSPPAQSIKEPQ